MALLCGAFACSEGLLSAAEEYLDKAVHQRAKMARNLAQADEFIKRISR
jgi:hypothetical protein